MPSWQTVSAILLALLAAAGAPADAADYYAGKSIDFVVGTPPGGYDIYARVVARHLGRHIPGQPTIVVKNMPGAGSAKAGQFISMMAPKDGTAIAAIMPGAIMGPLLDERADAALFDPTKVLYVGTANSGTRVCFTLKGSKITTFDDVLKQKAVFGGVSTNDSTQEYGYLHKHTSGAQYDVVSGYRSTPDIGLAIERGELDGACGWDWSSLKAQKPDWLRDNRLNVLLQVSLDPHPELTRMGVPTVWQYVKNDDDRKIVELVVSQTVFHRSYIAPPGTPQEQLETLRTAFDATVRDRDFLDDAEKMRIDVAPLPGAKVQELVAKLYATPRDVVGRARAAIRP